VRSLLARAGALARQSACFAREGALVGGGAQDLADTGAAVKRRGGFLAHKRACTGQQKESADG